MGSSSSALEKGDLEVYESASVKAGKNWLVTWNTDLVTGRLRVIPHGKEKFVMPVKSIVTVPEVVPKLVIARTIRDDQMATLRRETEALFGQVAYHLAAGSWSRSNGFDFGVADEVSADRDELERALSPLSDRPPDPALAHIYIARLSERVLEAAALIAAAEQAKRINDLKANAIDAIAGFTGTDDDVLGAMETVNALAFATAWPEVAKPSNIEQADWDDFVESAEAEPAIAAARILGWLPQTKSEIVGGCAGFIAGGGGVGWFSQAVAAGAGLGPTGTLAMNSAAGMVGAVASALLGILAVRFVAEK